MGTLERIKLPLRGAGSGAIFGHRGFVVAALGEGRDGQFVLERRWREVRLKAVVVPLRERLELVVVAARATNRLREKHRRRGVGHVIERVVTALDLVG